MIWWLDVTIINKTSCDTYKSNDMYSKLHITYEKESLNSDGLTKENTILSVPIISIGVSKSIV
jgi:hypothetical protein